MAADGKSVGRGIGAVSLWLVSARVSGISSSKMVRPIQFFIVLWLVKQLKKVLWKLVSKFIEAGLNIFLERYYCFLIILI